jgi:release factor glutamine methyltransferase
MPIQYVLGEWPFRQVTLKMSPPVFIPRPETEQLVELVSGEIVRKGARHVLDLCCGSGAISLALLREHPAVIKILRGDCIARLDFFR